MSCREASRITLAALAHDASEAQLLALESHLAECASCRVDHAALEGVRRLRDWEPAPLAELARERARQATLAALRSAAPPRAPRVGIASRRLGTAIVALASVAAILVAVLRPPADRVLDGDLAVLGGRGEQIRDGVSLRSGRGGRASLASASVEFKAATLGTWRQQTHTLELARGSVTVDVTPGKGLHFRVSTPRFAVEVVGTRFTVGMDSVETEHGKVRVVAGDGSILAVVADHERWTLAPRDQPAPTGQHAVTAPPLAAPPVIAPSVAAPQASAALPRSAPPPRSTAPASVAPSVQLAEARRSLARGDGDHARLVVEPLLHGPRGVAVEARSVLAESYLIEGRYGDAIESYRAVVRDFDGTTQAESALFAIAQLQLENAQHGDAARTLARYLARYPQGRFAREAREHASRIPPAPR